MVKIILVLVVLVVIFVFVSREITVRINPQSDLVKAETERMVALREEAQKAAQGEQDRQNDQAFVDQTLSSRVREEKNRLAVMQVAAWLTTGITALAALLAVLIGAIHLYLWSLLSQTNRAVGVLRRTTEWQVMAIDGVPIGAAPPIIAWVLKWTPEQLLPQGLGVAGAQQAVVARAAVTVGRRLNRAQSGREALGNAAWRISSILDDALALESGEEEK